MEKQREMIIDGKLDEALWQNAKEYTGFRRLKSQGGQMAEAQTFVKIVPLEVNSLESQQSTIQNFVNQNSNNRK